MATTPEIPLTIGELQTLTAFAVECTTKTLYLFEKATPEDTRPRDAINAAKAFVTSGKRSNDLRMKGLAAYKASREASTPAAAQAAESATQAVGAAYLHPLYDGRQVKHILGTASHAAYAIELEANNPEASYEYQSWVIQNTPTTVIEILKRYPLAPQGGGRAGELLRHFDEALRTR